MVSPRVQRWTLTLSAYDFIIKFNPWTIAWETDGLSRYTIRFRGRPKVMQFPMYHA